jgi:hypothetical protein
MTRGKPTLENVGWRFLYLLKDVIHFSAASTVANLDTKKRNMNICAKKQKGQNIQNEPVSALAIPDMPRECPHTADLTKRRSHRQQLVFREMRWQPIDIDIGCSALRVLVGCRLVLLLLTGLSEFVFESWTAVRVCIEEEGSAGLGVWLSVKIDFREWDGLLSGRCGKWWGCYRRYGRLFLLRRRLDRCGEGKSLGRSRIWLGRKRGYMRLY